MPDDAHEDLLEIAKRIAIEAGEAVLTDELTFTSAPPATVVSLAAGWTVTASLDGASGADLQVYLSEM